MSSSSTGNIGLASSSKCHMLLYKHKCLNFKDIYRERCRSRIQDGRNQLIDKFRKINITDDWNQADHVEVDVDSIMKDELHKLQIEKIYDSDFSQQDLDNLTEQVKREIDEEQRLYWDGLQTQQDQRKSTHIISMLNNHNLLVCFICKQFTVNQMSNGDLICPCGDRLQTNFTLEQIKENLRNILIQHSSLCSNQFPNFAIFKANFVVFCDNCDLNSKIV